MALIAANSSRIGTVRAFSGTTTVAGGHRRENISPAHTHLNWSAGWHTVSGVTDRSSVPEGARHPVAWKQARKAGGLASRSLINGTADLALAMAAGKNAVAALDGLGAMAPAPLQLVVSAVAAISGSGSINALLAGKLEAAAALAGAGDLDGAIGALAGVFATLDGDGSLSGTMRAIGHMEATVTPFTELSPQSLAAAVWASVIEAGLNAEEAMRLIAAATAGKVSGAAGTTVTIRNAVADDKNRIVATVDSSGNRTAITYDLTD